MTSEPLWYYEPGTPAWEQLVAEATDEADWDALEAAARTGQFYHVVIRRESGLSDRIGPYPIESAVGIAYETMEWDRRTQNHPPRQVDLEPA